MSPMLGALRGQLALLSWKVTVPGSWTRSLLADGRQERHRAINRWILAQGSSLVSSTVKAIHSCDWPTGKVGEKTPASSLVLMSIEREDLMSSETPVPALPLLSRVHSVCELQREPGKGSNCTKCWDRLGKCLRWDLPGKKTRQHKYLIKFGDSGAVVR